MNRSSWLCMWLCLAALLFSLLRGRAEDPAGIEFFERKIRPILVNHCYECHSHAAKKHKGKLYLDSRAGIRKGGESGPAVVPGKPNESWLLKAVRHQREDLKMPPKGKLPPAVIVDLEAWIKMGAPDPREKDPVRVAESSWEEVLKKRRQWWSLQPVKKPELPEVKNAGWSKHPLDRFILAKLEKASLKPAAHADKRTLVRRLSLVLTGLPPTPAQVDLFLLDDSPKAYENLVDRLLDSPHFGERWARHWLDVVRFAETHGNEWNYEVHHAWRYRDYLIRAFNQDVPYDRFVAEHIAGDLLPPRWNRAEKFNESPVGTAFYRFGEVNHDDCLEFRQIGYDLVDNQLDTLTKTFQATTVACARCHDHKIDAISMKDYYALLGILRSSRQVTHTLDIPAVNESIIKQLTRVKKQIRHEQARIWLKEADELGRYLEAISVQPAAPARKLDGKRLNAWKAVFKADNVPLESPLHVWRRMQGVGVSEFEFPVAWLKLKERLAKESRNRADFNAKNFVSLVDVSKLGAWQVAGQGLAGGASAHGDFAVSGAGDHVLTGIYPAGLFTHLVSEKLNGVLRSPILNANKKYISFHLVGNKTSAVRLVSNNCQLNYVNYQALSKNEFTWKKFAIPPEARELGTYAELMTKFDNPKFPDQLGTLGGDTYNARVPWEEAAKDPHSYFGVTQVVLHDCAETPRAEMVHLQRLFSGKAPADLAGLAVRYREAIQAAIKAWAEDKATAEDVYWLDWLMKSGLIANSRQASPQLLLLVDQYRNLENRLALPRIVPGMADGPSGFDQPLLARGDFRKPAELVPRRYLEVLDSLSKDFIPPVRKKGSGRFELAMRIASADNPLTARVIVNRIWHHLFGSGIVRTVDDFGRVGELPSHPELLDYLAAQFVADGWSIKKLIRSLVLTETFRMSSRADAACVKVDPQNRLLHHFPARRFEAEAIRDAILFASGRLDKQMFGPSIHPFREGTNADRRLFPGPLDGNGRRSLYIKVNLMEGPKFLGAFNFPGGKVTQGRRDVTNVPAQALALLNDPFVLQQADFWAKRLVARKDKSVADRIEHMFQIALARPTDKEEREQFGRAVTKLAELHGIPVERIMTSQILWHDVAHAIFNLKEFIYIR